jgi:hypothetical protein
VPAERVPALIAAVRTEGDFDVDEATALRWLNDAHRLMVKRSGCYRKRISLGVTEANVRTYGAGLLDEVIEVIEVLVGGVPYGHGRHSDIAAGEQGWLLMNGPGGVAVEDESTGGGYELTLVAGYAGVASVPTGAPIEVYAVCRAPVLLASDDTTLKTPAEYDPGLISGAFATGLERDEGRMDMAPAYRAQFEGACTELKREVTRRNAPRQARVAGYTL